MVSAPKMLWHKRSPFIPEPHRGSIIEMDFTNTEDARRILETALLCAHQPMAVREMRALFADQEVRSETGVGASGASGHYASRFKQKKPGETRAFS